MASRKLKIAFISPKRYAFYPLDYLGRGLGGAESMLVLLAEALYKRGHKVEVYNCCFKPGLYNGVAWKSIWSFSENKKFDIVVSLRLLETFNDFKINSPLRALWIHDESLLGATEMDMLGKINMWISISETQKQFIEKKEHIKDKNWFVTRNAFDENIYNEKLRTIKKIHGQAIYCSAPDRGLTQLLNCWPEIKKNVPWAKLIITGSFALWGNTDEENDRFFEEIYDKLGKLKDVSLLKRYSKKNLAEAQAQSQIMLYPTIFNEMFCISALECMSVGTPIVSTRKAAMEERIKHNKTGYLVAGNPFTKRYQDNFIASVVELFKNDKVRYIFSSNSIQLTKDLNFANLAIEWEEEILNRLNREESV